MILSLNFNFPQIFSKFQYFITLLASSSTKQDWRERRWNDLYKLIPQMHMMFNNKMHVKVFKNQLKFCWIIKKNINDESH